MNKILSLNKIKDILEGEDSILLAVQDRKNILKWVHPENITGIDTPKVKRINRIRFYLNPNEDNLIFNDNYENDDDLIIRYMKKFFFKGQHLSLIKNFRILKKYQQLSILELCYIWFLNLRAILILLVSIEKN